MENKRGYRSFFWPILLIGIGLIWLMGNLGVLPSANFATIFRFWPLILIVIGLDLVVGRMSSLASIIIGLLTVGVIVAALVAAPALGIQNPEPVVETLNEPVSGAQTASINLNLSSYPTNITTVENMDNLFEGEIGVYGDVQFNTQGESSRRISLTYQSDPTYWWGMQINTVPLRWDIGLNPEIPMDLTIDGGSGSADLDLSDIMLTGLDIDVGSGSFELTLPTTAEGYLARLEGGSGALRVNIEGSGNLTLELDGASGSQRIELPAGLPVRIEVLDDGSGSLRLPQGLDQIEFEEDDQGIWQSQDYDDAASRILIRIVDAGSGSITIR